MAQAQSFHSFIDLVKFDQRFHELNRKIRAAEKEVADITKKREQIAAEHEGFVYRAKQARKKVDEHELEMKSLQEAEKLEKERLDQVSNEKEYVAIKREIASLYAQQQDDEAQLVDAWNKLETSNNELEHHTPQFEEKEAQLASVFDEKSKELAQLRDEYQKQMEQRTIKEEGIPQEWLTKYNVMREQVVDPVVPVINKSCSACFYAIPPQDIVSLKKGKLVSCKDCYRLLYWEDEAELVDTPKDELSQESQSK